MFKLIAAALPADREGGCRAFWRQSRTAGSAGANGLEFVPSNKTAKGLTEQIEKVGFLRELGADRMVLPDLPLAGLEHFARR